MSALLLTTPQFVLDKVEYFLRDNRWMAVLDIVLGDLSLIRFLFLLKEIYPQSFRYLETSCTEY